MSTPLLLQDTCKVIFLNSADFKVRASIPDFPVSALPQKGNHISIARRIWLVDEIFIIDASFSSACGIPQDKCETDPRVEILIKTQGTRTNGEVPSTMQARIIAEVQRQQEEDALSEANYDCDDEDDEDWDCGIIL